LHLKPLFLVLLPHAYLIELLVQVLIAFSNQLLELIILLIEADVPLALLLDNFILEGTEQFRVLLL